MAEKTVKELKIALHKAISEFSDNVRSSRLSPQKLRNLNKEIEIAAQSLDSLHSEIDSVKRPHDVFDPGNPRTIGFFI